MNEHDYIAIDLTKTGCAVFLENDILDIDEITYNESNPYVVTSETTDNEPVDLTNAKFVKIYNKGTRSVESYPCVIRQRIEYIAADGNIYSGYRIENTAFALTPNGILHNDIKLFSDVYSKRFKQQFNMNVPNGKVVYFEPSDNQKEILLCDISVEEMHNMLKDTGVINAELYAGSHSGSCIYDLISGYVYGDHLACVPDDVNMQFYDKNSEFVKSKTHMMDLLTNCKTIVETAGLTLENVRIEPTSHQNNRRIIYEYSIAADILDGGKKVATFKTSPSDSIILKFPVIVYINTTTLKTNVIPFTRKELSGLGICNHWDSTIRFEFPDPNEPKNYYYHPNPISDFSLFKSLLDAIKQNGKRKPKPVKFTFRNNCESPVANDIVKLGNTKGTVSIYDNHAVFKTIDSEMEIYLQGQSTCLKLFTSLLSPISEKQKTEYVNKYADKRFLRIPKNADTSEQSKTDFAESLLNIVEPYSETTPDHIHPKNGSVVFKPDENCFIDGRRSAANHIYYTPSNKIPCNNIIFMANGEPHYTNTADKAILDYISDEPEYDDFGYLTVCPIKSKFEPHPRKETTVEHLVYLLDTNENFVNKIAGLPCVKSSAKITNDGLTHYKYKFINDKTNDCKQYEIGYTVDTNDGNNKKTIHNNRICCKRKRRIRCNGSRCKTHH